MVNVRRVYKIYVSLKNNSTKKKLLKYMCLHSRAIYNSAIYFQRQMYYFRTLLIKYYIENINNYYKKFSFNDILSIIKYIIRNKNILDDNDKLIIRNLLKNLYWDDIMTIKKNIKHIQFSEILNDLIDNHKFKKGIIKSIPMDYKTISITLNSFKKIVCFPKIAKKRLNTFLDNVIDLFEHKYKIYNSSYSINRRINRKNKKKSTKNNKEKVKKIQSNVYTKMNIIIPMIYSEDVCDLYIRIYVDSYKYVYSQVAQQTIKKVIQAYKSFFTSIKKNDTHRKIKLPNYLDKNGMFNLIFQNNSFKIIKRKNRGSLLRLSIGKKLPKNYNELQYNCLNKNYNMPIYLGENKYTFYKNIKLLNKIHIMKKLYCKLIKNKKYTNLDISIKNNNKHKYKSIYNPKYIYFNIGNKLNDCNIKEIEIVPRFNGLKYCLYIKYNISIPEKNKKDTNNLMSIDLGMINLAGIFITKKNKPLLFDGKWLLSINKYFNNKIDRLKSISNKINKTKVSKRIRYLLIKRENIISNCLHKLSRAIINYCKSKKLDKIIIGYNKNWKNKVNMNKRNNRKFYEIPFRKLVNQIFYKGEQTGITVVEINESYTSKIDALSLEKLNKKKYNEKRRIHRGLFKSNKTIKKNKKILINADVNGAINIMRKYCKKNKIKIDLKKIIGNNIKKILNPIKIKWTARGWL